MRKKFKIFYSKDNPDKEKAGKEYKPEALEMVMMSGQGLFFVYNDASYYPSIVSLSGRIGNYDVEWIN